MKYKMFLTAVHQLQNIGLEKRIIEQFIVLLL